MIHALRNKDYEKPCYKNFQSKGACFTDEWLNVHLVKHLSLRDIYQAKGHGGDLNDHKYNKKNKNNDKSHQ